MKFTCWTDVWVFELDLSKVCGTSIVGPFNQKLWKWTGIYFKKLRLDIFCGLILSLVQFLFSFVFVYGNGDNEIKTMDNKNWTKDKIEPCNMYIKARLGCHSQSSQAFSIDKLADKSLWLLVNVQLLCMRGSVFSGYFLLPATLSCSCFVCL